MVNIRNPASILRYICILWKFSKIKPLKKNQNKKAYVILNTLLSQSFPQNSQLQIFCYIVLTVYAYSIHTCTHTHIHTHTHTCTHTHAHSHTHTYTHTNTNTYTHTQTHTHNTYYTLHITHTHRFSTWMILLNPIFRSL